MPARPTQVGLDPVYGLWHEVRRQFVIAVVILQLFLFGRDQCKDLFGMGHRLINIGTVIDWCQIVECDPFTVTLCIQADSRTAALQQ